MSPDEGAATSWSPLTRVAFRFAFAYFVLYSFPIPGPLQPLAHWLGESVLGLDVITGPTGSGDTGERFAWLFMVVVLSVPIAGVWSLIDRRRRHYARLHDWLRIFVRYVLGGTMLSYGAAKVIKSQFIAPGLIQLLQPYGDSSPMGLLWTFMGFSTPYTVWAGAAEFLGGALLFFRRTTTLGALVLVAVLTNVVLMNLSYDVPVKQYSMNLLAMALFLTFPDVRRLWAVFVSNQPARPADLGAPFRRPSWNRGAHWLRLVLLVGAGGVLLYQSWTRSTAFGDLAPKPYLYGIYDVEEFVVEGDTLPPLTTDSIRWSRMVIDRNDQVGIDRMNGAHMRLRFATDSASAFRLMRGLDLVMSFEFEREADGSMTVRGVDERGDSVRIGFTRRDESDLLLTSRGFRWVQEVPFNR